MMGCRPVELLNMPQLERELAVQVAGKLEKERWKRMGKIMGG